MSVPYKPYFQCIQSIKRSLIPRGGDLEAAVPQVCPGGVLERDVELEIGEVVAVVVEEGEEASLEGQLCKF